MSDILARRVFVLLAIDIPNDNDSADDYQIQHEISLVMCPNIADTKCVK